MSGAFGPLRDAASDATAMLGYQPVRAEDYPASPFSAQVACLASVRSADAVVLILGSQYGSSQASGLSATHEEYREARETSRPVLAFIEEADQPESQQADFIQQVRDWEQGHYTASFRDATDLRTRVAQGLHQHLLTQAATPLEQDELERHALALIAPPAYTSGTLQVLSIVGGPSQLVIRPAELESRQLSHYLQDEAHRGPDAVLSHSATRPYRSEET